MSVDTIEPHYVPCEQLFYSSFHLVPRSRDAWAACYDTPSHSTHSANPESPLELNSLSPLSALTSLPSSPAMSPVGSCQTSPTPAPNSLHSDTVVIQTNYDPAHPENRHQPIHIHDREKNLVWTQAERVCAGRAEAPISLQDLEHKVYNSPYLRSCKLLMYIGDSCRRCTRVARNPLHVLTSRCRWD